MDQSLVIVVAACAVLVGVVALAAAVHRAGRARRGRRLGDVSVEWLTRQKVRDRRGPGDM